MSASRRAFIDANVFLYLLSTDDQKADGAERLLRDEALDRVISTQTIGEFVHIARRKARLDFAAIRLHVDMFRDRCRVEQVTQGDQDAALAIAERLKFGWWDSQLVATAIRCGADVLLTEDLQHGQRVGALSLENPFR